MNNTVQKIIDFDKAARQSVGAAKAEAQRITDEAEKKRIAISEAAKNETEAETKRICDEIRKKSDGFLTYPHSFEQDIAENRREKIKPKDLRFDCRIDL